MGDYLPKYTPGAAITLAASADITGGQLLEVSGDETVKPAAAASAKWVGYAGYDVSSGDYVTVFSGGIQHPTASGAVAAGDLLVADTGGKVKTAGATPAAGTVVGVALAAAADGDPVTVKSI